MSSRYQNIIHKSSRTECHRVLEGRSPREYREVVVLVCKVPQVITYGRKMTRELRGTLGLPFSTILYSTLTFVCARRQYYCRGVHVDARSEVRSMHHRPENTNQRPRDGRCTMSISARRNPNPCACIDARRSRNGLTCTEARLPLTMTYIFPSAWYNLKFLPSRCTRRKSLYHIDSTAEPSYTS
jgi:hypothetical protein